MEETDYRRIASRDVNNYVAVKTKPADTSVPYSDYAYNVKGKGAYSDQTDKGYIMRRNPGVEVCNDAVKALLKVGKPIEETIFECDDIRRFVTVKKVAGGAVKDGAKIGTAVRWYYGKYELDAIYYESNGNKVGTSDGAVPLMNLPETLPDDIDYEWYVNEAYKRLDKLGVAI